jgi:hypothetical protein
VKVAIFAWGFVVGWAVTLFDLTIRGGPYVDPDRWRRAACQLLGRLRK